MAIKIQPLWGRTLAASFFKMPKAEANRWTGWAGVGGDGPDGRGWTGMDRDGQGWTGMDGDGRGWTGMNGNSRFEQKIGNGLRCIAPLEIIPEGLQPLAGGRAQRHRRISY